MAKHAGYVKITGTIGNLTYYKMGGEYLVRAKSSLTRKQFKTQKCFEGSRRSATRFGAGSKIASEVYGSLPGTQKVRGLFPSLVSKAVVLVKQGLGKADVKIALQQLVNPTERTQLQDNTTECPANNSLLSKDIHIQPVSLPVKAKRIPGLAGEKATSYPHNLPVTEQRKQFPGFVLRSERGRIPITITWCFQKGHFLAASDCFYTSPHPEVNSGQALKGSIKTRLFHRCLTKIMSRET